MNPGRSKKRWWFKNQIPFMGLNHSFINWSGNDKFMYKVTFPLRLVTFPGCTMTFTQATALESKLVFLKKYRVGIDETHSQWSGGQAQFDRLLFNAFFGKHTASIGSYINYIQPMSNITNFYWLRFRGNCAIRNSYDGSRKFSTSNRAAVTKPD